MLTANLGRQTKRCVCVERWHHRSDHTQHPCRGLPPDSLRIAFLYYNTELMSVTICSLARAFRAPTEERLIPSASVLRTRKHHTCHNIKSTCMTSCYLGGSRLPARQQARMHAPTHAQNQWWHSGREICLSAQHVENPSGSMCIAGVANTSRRRLIQSFHSSTAATPTPAWPTHQLLSMGTQEVDLK